MHPRLFGKFLHAALVASICGTASAAIPTDVTYRNFFGNMTFNRPLAFAQYPGEDSVYVVLEQTGQIVTVERQGGAWAKTHSAGIPARVVNGTGGNKCSVTQSRQTSNTITTGYYESRGLLGFAFHPDFRANRKYYVSYITTQDSSGSTHERTIVAERVADSTLRPRTADPERVLINMCQPGWDHKGGHIGFGHDGRLYYTSGDGGNQELWSSPNNPSLRRNSWLGKVVRIDVDSPPDPGKQYAVPADNPFVDSSAYLPEVWAWGLRNPWKWHFHPITGELWLGNVGYTNRDNIYRIPKGAYLGWPIWEGNHCSSSSNLSGMCAATGSFTLKPALDLLHNTEARSVTGGAFYIGDSSSPFHNVYFFGDYIMNWVRAARFDFGTGALIESVQLGNITNVVSFDRDSLGRIFAVSLGTGAVTANTGVVYILESPSFGPAGVTGVRAARSGERPGPLARADFLKNRDRFRLFGLDGRELRDVPAGAFLIREKGTSSPPRLMTLLD